MVRRLAVIAAAQYGLCTRQQATAAGIAASTLDDWCRSGRVVRVHPGVYRVAGAPVSWEQQVLGAVFQHPVGRFRIDFAYPELLIAIEVDGYGPHASRAAFQRDRSRQNDLVALGWTVLRFTWADVVKRPDHVARVLRQAFARARAGIPG